MRINDIIDRYFEGTSSSEDERMLKEYFSDSNIISEDLMYLKPMFDYLHDEADALMVLDNIKAEENDRKVKHNSGSTRIKKIIISMFSVAASLVIVSVLLFSYLGNSEKGKSYVWVDGKKITKTDVVNKYAMESLTLVSSEDNILENQLSWFFE